MSISNCGHDERNRYSGGQAGDQSKTEWYIRPWWNDNWNVVLRHPDAKTRNLIADMAIKAAQNNLVGYDQNERLTFWNHLKASNYDPAQITVKCEADCSSGVAAIVKGAGYRLGNAAMQNVNVVLPLGMRKMLLRLLVSKCLLILSILQAMPICLLVIFCLMRVGIRQSM